ncbi:MAG: hypothetical protein V1754_01695, partial [Pseudomonadota bacterium]
VEGNFISRSDLKLFLQRGAQSFISLVDVRPAFNQRKFFGWRIVGYRGPGNIRLGDIVISVNNKPIERPDQFMAVWNGLATDKELVIDLSRDGKRISMHYSIVD